MTAVVYVSRVRFDDGQTSKANLANVIGDLKKIDADFDPAILRN